MKALLILLFIFKSSNIFAQDLDKGISASSTTKSDISETLEKIYSQFKSGSYEEALSGLNKISPSQKSSGEVKNLEGLVHYWKGLCLLRLNEFDQGLNELEHAIRLKYEANDIYYEYGQALYTSLKLKTARKAFRKSILKRYKMAVSMYYIASISQELGDLKTAATFYNGIEKLPEKEKTQVVQAARMKLGDIYMEQIKKQGGGAQDIEKYALKQYRSALSWDDKGPLALEIKNKIETIERRYDLVMFQLRNGRPTARPPHFFKANITYTQDDNVNALGDESKKTMDAKQYAAASSDTGFYGRYAFYPNATFSLVPQIKFGHTNYFSDEKEITKNNGYFFTATVQGTYEHTFNDSPATTFLDVGHTYNADDADQDDKIEKSDTTTGFTLSEQVQLWRGHPTIFRLKHYQTQAEDETADRTLTGATYEQIINLGATALYLYTAFDQTRYAQYNSEDNDAVTGRLDVLLPDLYGLFNTNLYGSVTQTNYLNDSDRGAPELSTFGVNFNRPFGRNYFTYLDIAFSSQSASLDADIYKRQKISLNIDYIF